MRVWNLVFYLFVKDDFCSNYAEEVFGVYPLQEVWGPLIARWSRSKP